MNNSLIGTSLVLAILLSSCGSENEAVNQEPAPSGVLSTQQRQALDTANSVEQMLLDSANQRKKEMEAQLRAQ